jgi:hypothetical protein
MTPAGLAGGAAGAAGFGVPGARCAAAGIGGGIAIETRDLQSAHVMNFAPPGTLASGTRLSVPQAEQVASIIRCDHTPARFGRG